MIASPVAIGCMRLSTEPDRDDVRAVALLVAALNAGVTLLDTADAYCWNETDTGHNERLIRRALETWGGDRAAVRVATKGGLTRPNGAWVSDGRAKHLVEACESSCKALGVSRIDLYQLHAPDPRTPLATSVRALASLKRDGLVHAIGLCNVNVEQMRDASQIVEVASVQVELSPWRIDSILNGVAGYCIANGIQLLAYRPLGGAQRRRRVASDPVLNDVAAHYDATPFEIALAWLHGFDELIVPLPGPTRVDTVHSIVRARGIQLTDSDRTRLDAHFSVDRQMLHPNKVASIGAAATRSNGEVVLIMGLPAAGKSTAAQAFVAQGYQRLNRDEAGGSLTDLAAALDRSLASGSARIVLDNTYISRAARARVIDAARKHGLPVRCVWLSTSVEDAQVNAASRIISTYGRLLDPTELRKRSKHDTAAFGPGVQFRYQRDLERPNADEGFSRIDVVDFARAPDPALTIRAVVIWCDGVLWRSKSGRRAPASPDDVEVIADRAAVLRKYHEDGWLLLGLSWQPDIADNTLTPAQADASIARMQELLGLSIEVAYCPHAAGPPTCWCRKPLPGLGVLFIHHHRLNPAKCIYVGTGAQDPGFARRLGFEYRDAASFFASEP